MDLQVLQKVLPMLHGTQQKLLGPLWRLLLFAAGAEVPDSESGFRQDLLVPLQAALKEGKGCDVVGAKPSTTPAPLPRSARKLLRRVNTLQAQGFVSFIE